ncbi:probable leucine-rich repeat receptor-like protein kinase At1g68400 [Salvia miltiorrhiza]|uniref:probable leucine-rich repeat receptor-like protein kinase At1g68400 n=1 Tax=Salvia miltiorrhiza TaxID=226208 RepID=UPI0025AC00BB|nr:probable leucine-rich repeat receptor-like protein kinase At1g68400 [Salvia miltiorrhiza]
MDLQIPTFSLKFTKFMFHFSHLFSANPFTLIHTLLFRHLNSQTFFTFTSLSLSLSPAMPSVSKLNSNPNPTTLALFLLLLLHCAAAADNPDLRPLLLFKSAADPHSAALTSWNASTDPCTASWLGVTCLRNRVSRLILEDLRLRGGLPRSLASLTQLRVLSLKQNGFSGQIPDLSNLTSLKLLFLSHNRFSGAFPSSLASLSGLYRLDLSHNSFSGRIPAAVNGLTRLLTLRLEGNGFSGPIPGLILQNLHDFNVSRNGLTGRIPDSLSTFQATSFLNNRALCGPPLEKCAKATVPSSPTTETKPDINSENNRRGKFSSPAIIGIIVGDALVLGLVSMLLYCYFWRSYSNELESSPSGKSSGSGEKTIYSSSPYPNPNPGQSGCERGRIVFLEGVRRFELEDLLRASAEMLGKGGLGTAYKAVLDDGNVVAVKRLKDLGGTGKKEFEQQMEVVGKLKHPNLVDLKAYYFAKDEKLLVYDYMPNGNLFWLLHGNRGPGRRPLDWATRLKIAAGAARGIAFIHSSCKSLSLIHGNIKSTNILIDGDGAARVSDSGLSALSPLPKPSGYRAPEASDGRRMTQKCDVYAFGVLLLELLTGKCPAAADLPRWVQSVVREEWTAEVFDLELMRDKGIEEEMMVRLLQIGMACAQASPEHRPKMGFVVKVIDELRRGTAESVVSVSDSPADSEEAL